MFQILRLLRQRKRRARVLDGGTPLQWNLYFSALVSVLYVVLLAGLHTAAMMHFEHLSIGDSLWLTATSITTVGYGDLSASSWQGRLSTTLIIYVGGIFLVGKIAGDFFDYRAMRRTAMKQGDWDWSNLEDHVVVLGSECDSEHHLKRLFAEFESHERTSGKDMVLVSTGFPSGLPQSLEALDVKLVASSSVFPETLSRAGVGTAQIIIVLAWSTANAESDGRAFDVVHRLKEMAPEATIVAECVEDGNRSRLESIGASLVLRPVRAYPEMIVGSLMNPGSHEILENLFTAQGEAIVREDVSLDANWKDIVLDYVGSDRGIPIAYRLRNLQQVVTAPPADTQVFVDAVYLLQGDGDFQ